MDVILTPSELAKILDGSGSLKTKSNVIRRQCVDGVIKNCEKIGGNWYINASKEFPGLVGKVETQSEQPAEQREGIVIDGLEVTADTTIGELFTMLAKLTYQ